VIPRLTAGTPPALVSSAQQVKHRTGARPKQKPPKDRKTEHQKDILAFSERFGKSDTGRLEWLEWSPRSPRSLVVGFGVSLDVKDGAADRRIANARNYRGINQTGLIYASPIAGVVCDGHLRSPFDFQIGRPGELGAPLPSSATAVRAVDHTSTPQPVLIGAGLGSGQCRVSSAPTASTIMRHAPAQTATGSEPVRTFP